jgi:NAD(P)-dependent dehydrogenase (short-subunit alcohol dehydrogenase family)
MSGLDERVMIVTGAAQGLGRAIAIEAARQGVAWVTVADHQDIAGGAVAEEIRAAGAKALFVHTDLRKSADIEHMIAETVRLAGGLDVLVNNAGVTENGYTGGPQTVESLSEEAWDALMDINVKAMWLATKFAAPHLRRSKRTPAIVNAASVASTVAYPGIPAYSAGKAAVAMLTQAIAVDLASDGIRCNAYAPGAFATPMYLDGLAVTPDRKAAEAAKAGAHLIKRLGRPEEAAKLACFLASADASFCTGSVYRIDGGTLAWRGNG